jgi:hypothetical protein
MVFVQAFRRVFLACIPHRIESDRDPVYARRLAGFPVNICCASLRGELGPEYATYYFDPPTFVKNSEERRVRYNPQEANPSGVEVVIRKDDGHMATWEHREEELVCQARA